MNKIGNNSPRKDSKKHFITSIFLGVRTQKEQEFIYLKQRNIIVMENEAKFMELAKFVPRLGEMSMIECINLR